MLKNGVLDIKVLLEGLMTGHTGEGWMADIMGSAFGGIHPPIAEWIRYALYALPCVDVVAGGYLLHGGHGVAGECPDPFVPRKVQVEPLGRYALERRHERPDILVDLVHSGDRALILCRYRVVHSDPDLLHYPAIRPVQVGVHDRSRAYATLQGVEGDIVRERAPACDLEEEVIGIVEGRHDAYLIVAYALFGPDPVMPCLAGLVLKPLEARPFEGFAKIDLVHLHTHAGPHLERRQVVVQRLQGPDPHEPGGLRAYANSLTYAGGWQMVNEALRIGHPLIVGELGVGQYHARSIEAPHRLAVLALPALAACGRLAVSGEFDAATAGTFHLALVDLCAEELIVQNLLYHRDQSDAVIRAAG